MNEPLHKNRSGEVPNVPAYWARATGQICYLCRHCHRRIHRHGDCGEGVDGGGFRTEHRACQSCPKQPGGIYLNVVGVVERPSDLLPALRMLQVRPALGFDTLSNAALRVVGKLAARRK